MLRRHAVAAAALVALFVLLVGPAAHAAGRVQPPSAPRTPAQAHDTGGGEGDGGGKHGRSGRGNGNGNGHGNGNHHGHDPCDEDQMPAYCQSAPEAPAGLLYPAAAAIALTVFFGFERRRRTRSARAA